MPARLPHPLETDFVMHSVNGDAKIALPLIVGVRLTLKRQKPQSYACPFLICKASMDSWYLGENLQKEEVIASLFGHISPYLDFKKISTLR